jgi:hypothetical protein
VHVVGTVIVVILLLLHVVAELRYR